MDKEVKFSYETDLIQQHTIMKQTVYVSKITALEKVD